MARWKAARALGIVVVTHASFAADGDVPERLRSLLDQVPLDAAAKRRLCMLVSKPDRHYHGVDHLALLWERHRRYGAEAGMHDPVVDRMIACAIAYHDAIYDARRRDNEVRSAELWVEASAGSSLPEAVRTWVADTIVATRDHLAYASPEPRPYDAQPLFERARLWFLDLDLSPIGESADEFDANTARLRAENSDRPEDEQERGRLQFLARIAAYPRIFRSPVLAEVFEGAARDNLARELA